MSAQTSDKINLLNFDRPGLERFFEMLGEKPFRAMQVMKWIHQLGVDDFDQMTNLSKALRIKLQQTCEVRGPEVTLDKESSDGTRKWMLKLPDGNLVETVYIPEDGRGTLCVSSQVGCSLNCSFCSTGKQGFSRNLDLWEIIGQVWIASRSLGDCHRDDRRVTNVVMMGMGEPLLNFDNVVGSMNLMMEDNAYGLSKRRVTLSTAGMAPQLRELKKVSECSLALSLHAPNDLLRGEIVPLNKKYAIKEVLDVCRDYFNDKRVVTIEYVMLHEVNDREQHATELAALLADVPCKLNLIPFNPFPGTIYQRSSNNAIHRFSKILQTAGINTTTRKTRGDDIDAACGQLVGKVQDKTRRQERALQERQERELQVIQL